MAPGGPKLKKKKKFLPESEHRQSNSEMGLFTEEARTGALRLSLREQ